MIAMIWAWLWSAPEPTAGGATGAAPPPAGWVNESAVTWTNESAAIWTET
jgi:hypothetical protein